MASKGIMERNNARLTHLFRYEQAEKEGKRKKAIEAAETKRKEAAEIDRICRYILGIEDEDDTTKHPKA